MKLIKVDNIYTLIDGDKMIASSDLDFQTDYEVMKLSKQNCDEIFGVINIIDLAERNSKHSEEDYIEGFNKAMELNKDKLFTVEDMRQAYDNGMDNIDADGCAIDDPDEDFFDTLRCIQQPKEIEVEIEMRPASLVYKTNDMIPKLDRDGCLVLKKK